MSDKPGPLYTTIKETTGFGLSHKFVGPGMPQYANKVHFLQPSNEWTNQHWQFPKYTDDAADTMIRFLYAAYEAGRESMRRDMREMLGVHSGPFGISVK